MNGKSERGAVLIEGVLSLSFFMFAMITIYSVFHISMAQARIGAALNATAKEISQYSYVYDLTSLNTKQANLAANGGAAASHLSDNLGEVDGFFDAIGGLANGTSAIASSPENAESFLYYVLNEGIEQVKGDVTGVIAKMLMRKQFGSNPDEFLKGLGVEDGMAGLSFVKTRIFSDGEEKNIFLDVRYKIKVVELLNMDLTLKFEQSARTRAWVGSD